MVMTCSSSRPQHLLFFSFLFFFIPFLSLAQLITVNIDSSIWNFPSNTACLSKQSNFSGSLFSNNLNRLVSSIPSRHSNTYNFYHFSVGDQERVEATGLCNRVLTRVDCLNCISQAAVNLTTTTYCPAHREAYVRATKCMFRYSDKPILGKLETSPVLEAAKPNDAAGDKDEFIRLQSELLNRLRQEAAAGVELRGSMLKEMVLVHNLTQHSSLPCSARQICLRETATNVSTMVLGTRPKGD
ncbi:hypothetical protein HID58_095368 [Brassica napus]|uniref:Gnk2-homologous domain-containing protein n=1 Tax=Brassica napus TaxID=3708 RepID=A0ABQ7X3X4_BRANA|nr:hypothetical protein HID58_095368 [Brassica napus]